MGGSFRDDLLALLRCPYCTTGFAFEESPRPAAGRAEFGLLRCSCSVFPVVDGIPVVQREPVSMLEHTRGIPETEGISVDDLVALIRRGQTTRALLECIAPPANPATWQAILGWRLSRSRPVRELARWRAHRRFARGLLSVRDVVGAKQVLEFYYLSATALSADMGHYFIRRFGQPRHLAALSLAATIASEAKPVLDIACGIGTLEHYFACRNDPARVVGLDMNFYHLWIAKHWMAPAANYVCANANDGLPFANASFASTICSDAYHYIRNHAAMRREIERCAPRGSVVLSRVGNASVIPNEGIERSLEAYLDEFGPGVRTFDEAELIKAYLRNVDAFASPPTERTKASESKWLSFAWNTPQPPARTIAADTVPPHAVGDLGINPIYSSARAPEGNLRLHFQFPSVWYAYENHGMLAYHPRTVTVARTSLERLEEWRSDDHLRRLVDAFVLIGLPHRFQGKERRAARD